MVSKVKVCHPLDWVPGGEARRYSKRHPKREPGGMDNTMPMGKKQNSVLNLYSRAAPKLRKDGVEKTQAISGLSLHSMGMSKLIAGGMEQLLSVPKITNSNLQHHGRNMM